MIQTAIATQDSKFRSCRICNKDYRPRRSRQLTCSKSCARTLIARNQTHCKRGHELSGDNALIIRGNVRQCRSCATERRRNSPSTAAQKNPVETSCPGCGVIRIVSLSTATRMAKMPRLCRSCCRKTVRKGMKFAAAVCAKCHDVFTGRSGAARYCDKCAGRKPRDPKVCHACGKKYFGQKGKKACSNSCRRRLLLNDSYFGGRLFEARGWERKLCQICARYVPKKAHVHHVFGHPDHSELVVLCAGCHEMVSVLARRPGFENDQFKRLRWFAVAQRIGQPPDGEPIPVEIYKERSPQEQLKLYHEKTGAPRAMIELEEMA